MPSDSTAEIVLAALAEFDLADATVEPLESIDHRNIKVVAKSGSYFLKILVEGYDPLHLQSRLLVEDFLRAGGFSIPATILSKSGRRFASVRQAGGVERLAVLSDWIDGQTLGDRLDPDSLARGGELLARWHARCERYAPPADFEVRAWDEVYAPPPAGWLDRFLDVSPLDAAARRIVEQAAERMQGLDSRLPREPRTYGLIHADFHGDNLIDDGERIWIVDLDDVGWGHFVFDITWPTMLFAKPHGDESAYLADLLRGYESVRPLSQVDRELLAEGHIAAGIGALEMIEASPIDNHAPKAIEWFDFVVGWLDRHLESLG